MPRVAFLVNSLAMGGAETQLGRVIPPLSARGWEVKVFALTPGGPIRDKLVLKGITVNELPASSRIITASRLPLFLRQLSAWEPDVVVTFLYQSNIIGRVFRGVSRHTPVITSFRNEYFGSRIRGYVVRMTDRLSDWNVVNSSAVAEELVKKGLVSQSRLSVIPNAMPITQYDKYLSLPPFSSYGGDFVWIAVGSLTRQKDYPTLLKAWARINPSNARLLIIGEGPERDSLQALIKHHSLADSVALLGFSREVFSMLQQANGFVLTSSWEGSPNVILEALAASKPVVATDVGGVRELVQNAGGICVPPNNPRAVSEALQTVMALTEIERKRMGDQGRQYVEANHGLEKVVTKWHNLLLKISQDSPNYI